jgi:small subunit ribosomal protein S17|nr:ribosomal protein S17 [Meringosphaera mediterranea]
MVIKEKVGTVISNKMEKTIVVTVENKYAHPIYGKTLKKTKRFMAHDELNECVLGDIVLIAETKPTSRKKRWVLKKILSNSIL